MSDRLDELLEAILGSKHAAETALAETYTHTITPNIFMEVEPEEPLHGPELPHACDDGWESHTWELEFEDASTPLLTSGCQRCDHGVEAFRDAYPEELGSSAIKVKLELICEPGQPQYGVDPYVYLYLEPAS